MPRVFSLVAAATIALAAMPLDTNAAQRTFVATAGQDSNVCSLALPCRSFGAAIAQADAGGEIIVLDSGGYGILCASVEPVTMTAVFEPSADTPYPFADLRQGFSAVLRPSGNNTLTGRGAADIVGTIMPNPLQ